MKKLAFSLIAAALPFAASANPVSYTMDPFHTYVNFEVDHLGGLTKMRGRFDKTAGKFTIDSAARTGSVEVTVQTASVTTGDNERGSRPRSRDEHLRSPDFFNVAEFPVMGFRSTKVVFSGDNPAQIEGNATLLGVTRPISFRVDRWKCMPHPQSKREICGGNLSGTMKRSDFGMKFGIPSVGDELQLFVMVEGFRD